MDVSNLGSPPPLPQEIEQISTHHVNKFSVWSQKSGGFLSVVLLCLLYAAVPSGG
jgi:hypothetical protein